MALIYISKSDGSNNKYRLPANEAMTVQIGRAEGCLISLPDEEGISGVHCSISYVNGYYLLRDEGSTNGTLLEGAPIEAVYLEEGKQYKIGGATITYDSEGAHSAPAVEQAPATTATLKRRTPAAGPKLRKKKAGMPGLEVSAGGSSSIQYSHSPNLFFIFVVIVISFVAGMSLRHKADTGRFYPSDAMSGETKVAKPAKEKGK